MGRTFSDLERSGRDTCGHLHPQIQMRQKHGQPQTTKHLEDWPFQSRLDGPTPTPKKIVSLQPAHLETALQIFNTFDMTVLDEN